MPLFERDRYQRLDGAGGGPGRRSSSFCSSATIVIFVALCLVGAWMMASSNNIPVNVTPENKSEAKEQKSVDLADSIKGGGGAGAGGSDTTRASDEGDDTGKKDEGGVHKPQVKDEARGIGKRDGGGSGDTPQTKDDAGDTGKKDDDDGGDTPQTKDDAGDTGRKDDDASGATQTTDGASNDDSNRSDAAGTTDATASNTTRGAGAEETGKPAGGAVAEGETPSKNQTFSDENGKTEGGEVAKPEDPDKKVEQRAEEAATKGKEAAAKADKNAEEASTDAEDTGGQADKNAEATSTDAKDTGGQTEDNDKAASTDDKDDTGGQTDKSDQEASTTDANDTTGQAAAKETGGPAKNQTTSDGASGKMDGLESVKEDGKVAEKSSEDVAGDDNDGGKVESTGDDTGAGAASKNETVGDESVAPKTTTAFAAANAANATISQDTKNVGINSSSSTDESKSEAGGGDAAEKAELLPSGQADLLNETASAVAQGGTFPTQAAESSEEKKKNKKKKKNKDKDKKGVAAGDMTAAHTWKLCNVTAGADYIPCLDNEAAIKKLKTTKHYEHRERHCPAAAPTCLVPLPEGYRQPIQWPHSRDKIWYHNVPHTMLASYKGHQNWVKVSGEHLTFPGGGTQFKNGALHYIELIQEALPEVAWGRRSRVVLDVGCGVASFGGFLFDKDALTMSFAPKDEHEAQVQFALERGIPAVSAVMGTKRLPFPGNVFDAVHCARCRVPWHIEGGKLLLEVNRLLRPGGLFIWSATPVYRKNPEDVGIWHAMAALTKSMCWEMLKRTSDTVDQTAMVIFKKPTSNDCFDARTRPEPPLCEASDDQNAAWNITLRACMHRVPTDPSARGSQWPAQWPDRLATTPYWLSSDQVGVYGKPAPADFAADNEHWKKVVENSYLNGMGIDWKNVRNVMDMRAVYGGFAAALREMKVWVMNVVTINSPDTLPIIYERGLFGMYHDWCESFSTYPRSYDLVHADHLFSRLKRRCKLLPVMVEVDRILRPEGKLIVRDNKATAKEVQSIAKSLHWEVRMTVSKQGEELLCLKKTTWRPKEVEALS
ncbi:hypothetical protein ACP70R_020522 [Stipagrostis hirtigluma subsp. patula]